ncbi:MAG: siroheme decarboxylase subunit beta [Planctomycetota bacterium]|jgi:DNA-binding Lrp family transcriptional regulator
MTTRLSDIERRVIAAVEEGLAVSARPYGEAARRSGMSEETVIETLRSLASQGLLRRVSAILSPGALGLEGAALVAWRVEPGRLEECGRAFAGEDSVTHCLSRKSNPDWPYNLYTMVHAADPARLLSWVRGAAERFGVEDYLVMETVEELKKSPTKYSRLLEAEGLP